jgi:hypothetical protein
VGKIEPIVYTILSSSDITTWHDSLEILHLLRDTTSTMSRMISDSVRSTSVDEDDLTVESNISLKDHHMIHTLLKISENLDQNTLRIAKESEDKAKGFNKLERHKRLLILNDTENDSSEDSPFEPTEFCKAFLFKSIVYRAKEALHQGLKANREIVFIPSTAFAVRLYTVDLLWQSPDQPTGISLFYCAESSTPEPDHGYALLEKSDKSDVQRASKQTLEVPVSYSSALWMLKNIRAVMSLYFGEHSSTSQCLTSWISHFECNRIYYWSLQDADKSFLTQVLFAIDCALQIYLHSCGDTEDRRAVNTRILQMQDLQNNIERHNLSYILPRILLDKFNSDSSELTNDKDANGKKLGKKRDKLDAEKDKDNKKKQRIEDNHKHWHLKPNENFLTYFGKTLHIVPKQRRATSFA